VAVWPVATARSRFFGRANRARAPRPCSTVGSVRRSRMSSSSALRRSIASGRSSASSPEPDSALPGLRKSLLVESSSVGEQQTLPPVAQRENEARSRGTLPPRFRSPSSHACGGREFRPRFSRSPAHPLRLSLSWARYLGARLRDALQGHTHDLGKAVSLDSDEGHDAGSQRKGLGVSSIGRTRRLAGRYRYTLCL
jgi:hypothetical protein